MWSQRFDYDKTLLLKQALLGDKQIPYDVVQHNGHLIDGEASENIDYFEDVPEIDYKPLPNEEAR